MYIQPAWNQILTSVNVRWSVLYFALIFDVAYRILALGKQAFECSAISIQKIETKEKTRLNLPCMESFL